MAKIQQTLTITIDGTTYDVAGMSDQVKQMIDLFDDWRQQESDISGQLIMVRSALRDIQNSLLAQIRQEKAAVEAPVEAAGAELLAPVAKKAKTTKKA